MPQSWPLPEDGVLTVGVGEGVGGLKAVLIAKPMMSDIKANLIENGQLI